MCIIIACDPNCRPSRGVIERSFAANPDGAGLMYADGGTVTIRKGFMDLPDYLDALADVPDDVPLVLHMRIGTGGGNVPELTHPFPVTNDVDDLHALDITVPVGIAHNGVLHDYVRYQRPGISDTVAFIARDAVRLARSRTVRKHGGLTGSTRAAQDLRRLTAGSRLAILDGSGRMLLTGDGWNTVVPGVQASNTSWRQALTGGIGRGWYDLDDYAGALDLAPEGFDEWRDAAIEMAADDLPVPDWVSEYYERAQCAQFCDDYAECRFSCSMIDGLPYCASAEVVA